MASAMHSLLKLKRPEESCDVIKEDDDVIEEGDDVIEDESRLRFPNRM